MGEVVMRLGGNRRVRPIISMLEQKEPDTEIQNDQVID